MNGPKIYFTIPILGGIPITQTAASSFVVMLILCIAGIVLGALVANLLPWGIAALNAMAVAAVCFFAGELAGRKS